MTPLKCGCILVGNAIHFCGTHSEASPPPQWRPDQSRAEQAAKKAPAPPVEPLDETLPALQGKRRRQRWNPSTGELENLEETSQ